MGARGVKRAIAALTLLSLVAGCDRRKNFGGEDLDRRVERTIPEIEAASGLKFKTPPKYEVRTRSEVRDFLLTQFNQTTPAEQLRGEEMAYKQFGLLPDTTDLRRLLLEVLTEQVVGYYDPSTKVLYIVDGLPEERLSVTVSHELVHALQDQYVNLDSIQKLKGNSDRAAAAHALLEGHATYIQMTSMVGAQKLDAVLQGGWSAIRQGIRDAQASQPRFGAAPMAIQESLLFSYLSGAEFVRRLRSHREMRTALDTFPVSTEQVLSDDAFFGAERDAPSSVTLPPLRGSAESIHEESLGEFGTRLFLYQHSKDQDASVGAAHGWDGDRYRVLRIGEDIGIAWATVWDSATDAAQFVDAVGQGIGKRYRTGAPSIQRRTGVRTYTGRDRTVVITPVEVGGRNVVVYVDVPAGVSPAVLDPARITIGR
jgi:hypothetical protein